jgi:hypothetical protein
MDDVSTYPSTLSRGTATNESRVAWPRSGPELTGKSAWVPDHEDATIPSPLSKWVMAIELIRTASVAVSLFLLGGSLLVNLATKSVNDCIR